MHIQGYYTGYTQKEALEIPIEVGDTLLGGRFKNVKTKVKTIGYDELGQLTVNGKKLLNFRIVKTMPKGMQGQAK
jgi:hypothetical protein